MLKSIYMSAAIAIVILVIVISCASCVSSTAGVGGYFAFFNEEEKVFKKVKIHPKVGGTGGKDFELKCPEDSYVTSVSGTEGGLVNSISLDCSDGTTRKPVGNESGSEFAIDNNSGFDSVDIYTDIGVDSMIFKHDDTKFTKFGGIGGTLSTQKCKDGKVKGITGTYGDNNLVSVGVICGKYVDDDEDIEVEKPAANATEVKKVFKKSKEFDAIGNDRGDEFSLKCPEGSYVTSVTGNAVNNGMRGVKLKCSDETETEYIGEETGDAFDVSNDDGFTKLDIHAGDWVDGILPYNGDTAFAIAGRVGGTKYTQECEDGKIKGIKGKSDNRVRKLGVICGKYV